jgi:UDP-glucuronate decarboxylase
MRILVTGGAGFVGSHLIDELLNQGHNVLCLDSFFSGQKSNIAHHLKNPNFTLLTWDVREPVKWGREKLDRIYHLACPASPDQYQFDPVLTLETAIKGTQNMLELARRTGARMLFTSTSEMYGDPLEHPQKETYWGNVDPLGKRACYDEGKRAAETLCKDYHEQFGVDIRIVRIFNTYGPRMMFNDGRVLSNFVLQALFCEEMTVHGEGLQTRSFMYVSDLVSGLMKRMEVQSDDWRPVNLGNPDERSMFDLAKIVKERTHSSSQIIHLTEKEVPNRMGDPKQRKADITRAKELLHWEPVVSFEEGLKKTIEDFEFRLQHRPRVLVFVPTFSPLEGPAEVALRNIMERLSGFEFDVVTARMESSLAEEEQIGRAHVYRLGNGTKFDKYFLPLRGAFFARKLHKKNQYKIVWAVMASYGALAAALFSRLKKRPVPFLLSVYEGDINEKMLARGRWISPLYQFIFRRAHRWQVIGRMSEQQRAWLEDERHVQAIAFDKNFDLLAKRTKEMFAQIEILSTRL